MTSSPKVLAGLLVIVAISSGPIALARDDWELWTTLKWKRSLTNRWSLTGFSEGRFRRDFGEFYKNLDEIGLSYKVLSWLKADGAYRYEFSERAKTHDTISEHRILLSLIPQWKMGKFRLSDRNRLEFRHINGIDDWRYRNQFKVRHRLWEDSRWEISPFVADEIFYGFRAGELNRNRFFAGIEKPLTERLALELYYMVESNRTGSDWNEFHVLGLATNVTF